jgi:hypothetical protein
MHGVKNVKNKWVIKHPIPVAVRSKAQYYGRLFSRIAISNPVEAMNIRLFVVVGCLVGSSHRYEQMTISEESYRLCVCNCIWSKKQPNNY